MYNWLAFLLIIALFGIILLISLTIKKEKIKYYYTIFTILVGLVFIKNIIPLFSAGFVEFFSNSTKLSYLITSIIGDIIEIAILLFVSYIIAIIIKKVFAKNEK